MFAFGVFGTGLLRSPLRLVADQAKTILVDRLLECVLEELCVNAFLFAGLDHFV
jgi:hypothetical protein